MSLEEALEFIRKTDSDTWNLLVKEMNRTTKARAQEAAATFNIGELVSCDLPDQKEPLQGRIIKIDRGRVGLTPWLAQPVKTLFAVRCKTLDRLDYGTAF